MPCEHTAPTWDPHHGPNEEGWGCDDCAETLGYRPDLDRSDTYEKVRSTLFWFHDSKLIYISNGTMSDIVAENVAQRCARENRYDQWTILRFILEDPNLATHGDFWANRAERYLLGGEPIRQEQEALW
jgi:hypothetical protein